MKNNFFYHEQNGSLAANTQSMQWQIHQLQTQLQECQQQNITFGQELKLLINLIEAVPHIIWRADSRGRIVYLNSRWSELTGSDISSGLGHGYLQFIHRQDRELFQSCWQQTSSRPQAFEIQVRMHQNNKNKDNHQDNNINQNQDESYCWYLIKAQPDYNPQAEVWEWSGTFTNIDNFKQSEQELEQKSEFLNALLANLSDGIVACDRNGNLTLFNHASAEFHGLTNVKNLAPEKWAEYYDLYLADGKTRMRTQDIPLFRALQGESVRDLEMVILPKNGKSRFLLASGDPIINSNQQKLGAVVAMRDITEQKQALSQLSERDAFLRSIYEGTEVSIFVVDILKNGKFVYAGINPVHERLTGLSSLELQGKTPEQIFDPDFAARVQQRYQDCATSREMITYEEEFVWKHKQTCWLTSLKPLCDRDGQVYRLIGTSINITARKQAETEIINLNNQLEAKVEQRTEALKESEAQFRGSFEQVAVGFAHVDLNGKWLRVNHKLSEIVGFSQTEILQFTFQDITHPDDLEADLDYVRQLLAGEIDYYSLEKRYIRKDGSSVWVEITPSLMRDRITNQPQYFIVVVEEIEERKQAQLQLQQKVTELAAITTQLKKRNQELDQFAYVASHDLKAPLRAIANISQWLEEDLNGSLPSENQRQLEMLRGRVHRMEALINGLLEYSRIGRMQYPLETVDISKLLNQVINSLNVPANFQITIESQLPILLTQKVPLFQVISKLIDNAIQHHHRLDGKIHISVNDIGDYYQFSIRDDGIGIDPKYHQKIFTIFQTLEARDHKENTGIGLSIVKKIIDLQGGNIYVDSQVGTGTNIIFTWSK